MKLQSSAIYGLTATIYIAAWAVTQGFSATLLVLAVIFGIIAFILECDGK